MGIAPVAGTGPVPTWARERHSDIGRAAAMQRSPHRSARSNQGRCAMATRMLIGLVAILLTASAAGLSGCAAYYGPPATYVRSPYYYDYYY